jgi:hypothetical protein
MTTTITTVPQAKRRLKEIERAAYIFTHAIGVMEVDGWFGRGPNLVGISETKVPSTIDGCEDKFCIDGGAVCAGIAIDLAATRYAKARRWNKARTESLVLNSLDLLQNLNGRTPSHNFFRGIASWNDHDVTSYEDMKAAFGKALQALTAEKVALLRSFPQAGNWNLVTTT